MPPLSNDAACSKAVQTSGYIPGEMSLAVQGAWYVGAYIPKVWIMFSLAAGK